MKELFDAIREFRKSKKLVKDRADVNKEDEDGNKEYIKNGRLDYMNLVDKIKKGDVKDFEKIIDTYIKESAGNTGISV